MSLGTHGGLFHAKRDSYATILRVRNNYSFLQGILLYIDQGPNGLVVGVSDQQSSLAPTSYCCSESTFQ